MFKAKKNLCFFAIPSPIYETKVVSRSIEVNGQRSTVVSLDRVDVSDPKLSELMPSREEYTLENIVASGTSLNEINIENMLTPSEVATVEQSNLEMSEKLLNTIESLKN